MKTYRITSRHLIRIHIAAFYRQFSISQRDNISTVHLNQRLVNFPICGPLGTSYGKTNRHRNRDFCYLRTSSSPRCFRPKMARFLRLLIFFYYTLNSLFFYVSRTSNMLLFKVHTQICHKHSDVRMTKCISKQDLTFHLTQINVISGCDSDMCHRNLSSYVIRLMAMPRCPKRPERPMR